MTIHFFSEMERLKGHLLTLCARVEENLYRAVRSVEERNADLARRVIEEDDKVDDKEVVLEEECLKILALHQPVAGDLRLVVAVMKINNDLERIGDLAVNIAERAISLSFRENKPLVFRFHEMADKAQEMLKKSLDALVNMDAELAREVCLQDDEVDAMNREMYLMVQERLAESKSQEEIASLIHLLSVSRHLERVADHATNIAEDLVYMIEGKIVRHRASFPGGPEPETGE